MSFFFVTKDCKVDKCLLENNNNIKRYIYNLFVKSANDELQKFL